MKIDACPLPMSNSSCTRYPFLMLLAIDLPSRDRVIVKLALFTGARPGELLAIKRSNVHEDHVAITQRVYRGKIDTPKTAKSNRTVAIPAGVQADLQEWLKNSPSSEWLFPSENPDKPLNKDNAWGWRIQKGSTKRHQTGAEKGGTTLGEFSGAPEDAQHLDARSQR